tara:strand:- start:52 stop:393 length:342 start_codon:yes stop_codon:yes gene_type:complete
MNLVKCTMKHLQERCNERGADIKEASKSIVFRKDGYIYVNVDSPSYPKLSKGLGDYVSGALSKIGITPESVSKAIGKPCGCNKRKHKLNEFGKKFGIGGRRGNAVRHKKSRRE